MEAKNQDAGLLPILVMSRRDPWSLAAQNAARLHTLPVESNLLTVFSQNWIVLLEAIRKNVATHEQRVVILYQDSQVIHQGPILLGIEMAKIGVQTFVVTAQKQNCYGVWQYGCLEPTTREPMPAFSKIWEDHCPPFFKTSGVMFTGSYDKRLHCEAKGLLFCDPDWPRIAREIVSPTP